MGKYEDLDWNVRTVDGRHGTFILISDLQKIMLKDSVKMQRAGYTKASEYAETIVDNLTKILRG